LVVAFSARPTGEPVACARRERPRRFGLVRHLRDSIAIPVAPEERQIPQRPQHPAGMDAWLVTHYDDTRAVLADPEMSSRQFRARASECRKRRRRPSGIDLPPRRQAAITVAQDGARGADLVQDFALPIPSLVICEMLGVP
jgi:cytochrome P450